jgi:hypothetical protein
LAVAGPSLVVFNNATFTDADFQSIQVGNTESISIEVSFSHTHVIPCVEKRIGDSLKKDTSKGWKTGRFGVGFNSGSSTTFRHYLMG